MQKYSKGFSSYLSIGNNKGLNLQKDGPSYRINLFWISICIGFFDLEKMVHKLLEEVKEQEAYIENSKIEIQNIETTKKIKDDEITKLKEISSKEKQELKSQINEYKDSLSHLEESVKKLDDLENAMKEKIEELLEENEDLNNEITDLGDVHEENNGLKEKSSKYIKEIEELKAYIDSLKKSSSSSSSSSIVNSSSSSSNS